VSEERRDELSRPSKVLPTAIALLLATVAAVALWFSSGGVDCSDCTANQDIVGVLLWGLLPLAWIVFAISAQVRRRRA
jgi:hypothetical protein